MGQPNSTHKNKKRYHEKHDSHNQIHKPYENLQGKKKCYFSKKYQYQPEYKNSVGNVI